MSATIAYYGGIVTDGLVLCMDAGKRDSYPGFGTTWRSVARGATVAGNLVNGVGFSYTSGSSMVFDGIDDRCSFGDPPSLNISAKLTAAAWINGTQWTGKLVRSIFARWGDIGSQRSYKLAIVGTLGPPAGTVFLDVTGTGTGDNYILSSVALSLNTWNYVTGVYDGTNLLIYVNGIDRSQTLVGTVPSSIYTGASSFIVGDDTTLAQNAFSGNIASVQMYNRALSAQEVLQNYNALKGRFGL